MVPDGFVERASGGGLSGGEPNVSSGVQHEHCKLAEALGQRSRAGAIDLMGESPGGMGQRLRRYRCHVENARRRVVRVEQGAEAHVLKHEATILL
jgi:hypothetical protein